MQCFKGKYMDADGQMAIVIMSADQRDRFAKYPTTIAIDVCQPGQDCKSVA